MLTRVTLRNFDTICKIVYDKYGKEKEDKTILITSFQLLDDIINTMNVRRKYEEFLTEGFVFRNKNRSSDYRGLRDIKSIIADYSRVNDGDSMSACYEFTIGENVGSYYVELGDTEIIREKLVCKIHKKESMYYDFQKRSALINPEIIMNRTFLADICSAAAKFWGKHSMLAIISYQLDDTAEAYGKDSVINELKQVLDELSILSGQLSIGTTGIEELHKQYVVQNRRDEKIITFEYE